MNILCLLSQACWVEIKKEYIFRNKGTLHLMICKNPKVKAKVFVLVTGGDTACFDLELLWITYSV